MRAMMATPSNIERVARSHSATTSTCHTRLKLEGKDRMRGRGVASPDEWDAVALTFAEPVSDHLSSFRRPLVYQSYGVA